MRFGVLVLVWLISTPAMGQTIERFHDKNGNYTGQVLQQGSRQEILDKNGNRRGYYQQEGNRLNRYDNNGNLLNSTTTVPNK